MKKKEYVSLSLQIVDVKLSDCIAGSGGPVSIQTGQTLVNEVDGSKTGSGDGSISFGTW